MERLSVESSMIAEIGWASGTLEVLFCDRTKKDGTVVPGACWRYEAVPEKVYQEFLRAESIGQHFLIHIRSNYEGKKVEDGNEEAKTKEAPKQG